jgi:hypothetical protein
VTCRLNWITAVSFNSCPTPKPCPISDEIIGKFKQIAKTRELPAGTRFEVLGLMDPGEDYVFLGWWVRLEMPKEGKDGEGTYSFTIRERLVRSLTVAEAAREVEKTLRDTTPLPGRYRLEDRLKDLKKRAEAAKARADHPPVGH